MGVHDWLLLETLGPEHLVVAQGSELRKMVPTSKFLRRNPYLGEVTATVNDTISNRRGLFKQLNRSSGDVIRTEPITMSDGCIHGVHVWVGKSSEIPSARPAVGAVLWDLTTGIATDTPQALINGGMDPVSEPTHGRSFAADMPPAQLNRNEADVLALAINARPGETFCSTWNVARNNRSFLASFVSRILTEVVQDGSRHVVCRAMNWRSGPGEVQSEVDLAQEILLGLSQPNVHRVIVDLNAWKLLKWLDLPCPHFDWRSEDGRRPLFHPADQAFLHRTKPQLDSAPVTSVIRVRGDRGDWLNLEVTVSKISLTNRVDVGLMAIRWPPVTPSSDRSRSNPWIMQTLPGISSNEGPALT